MRSRTIPVAVAAMWTFLVANPVAARHVQGRPWALNFGGAFTPTLSSTADHVDPGWGLQLGLTRWFGQRPFGLQVDVAFNSLGLSDESLAALGVPDGDVDVWPFTVGGVYSPAQNGRVGFYVVGGLGPYLLHARATAAAQGSVGCDPWWWDWCFPESGSSTTTLGAVTKVRAGVNGGIGLTLDAGGSTAFYLEARYHQILVPGVDPQVMPLTFGIRW